MKMLILISSVMWATISFAASDSVYTSVAYADCKVIKDSNLEPEPEIDYYTGHCAGKAGYTVVVSGGDIRYSISLIYQNNEINLTNIGAFHDVGSSKVEWRGPVGKNGKIKSYNSLIYRLNITHYNEDDTMTNDDEMFVVRLNGAKSCLIGRVPLSQNMNEQARAIADDLSKPCLSEEFTQ